jgi:serine/threonine-protein kinase
VTDLRRVQELFELALESPPGARRDRLRAAGADTALLAEVEELLIAADAAPPFLDDELLGTTVGSYRIVARLRAGGMGVVYTAVRRSGDLEIPVALKVLRAEHARSDLPRLFRAEQQALQALRHPHIVALQDTGVLPDGRPFLVTELAGGEPIDVAVRRRGLAPRAIAEQFAAVCGAVQFAHQRLIVHCDLKPDHVLITDDGVPKLLDFGVARVLGASAAVPAWTAPYAAPEQQRGEAPTVAVDVHALGVILRELLDARSDRDLDAIVARATHAEPERRYPTASALQQDLIAWREGRPVAARAGGARYRLARFARRNRLAVAASAVALLSLLLAGALLVRAWREARDESRLGWGAHAQAASAAGFLEDLLLATLGLSGADYAAALDRAAIEAAARFADDPEAEGRARLALATLERAAGRADAALRHAERALALARTHRGFATRDVERAQRLCDELRAGARR